MDASAGLRVSERVAAVAAANFEDVHVLREQADDVRPFERSEIGIARGRRHLTRRREGVARLNPEILDLSQAHRLRRFRSSSFHHISLLTFKFKQCSTSFKRLSFQTLAPWGEGGERSEPGEGCSGRSFCS